MSPWLLILVIAVIGYCGPWLTPRRRPDYAKIRRLEVELGLEAPDPLDNAPGSIIPVEPPIYIGDTPLELYGPGVAHTIHGYGQKGKPFYSVSAR